MLAVVIAILSVPVPAMAEDVMRCGTVVIQGAETKPLLKEQVLELCGEPTKKEYNLWFYEAQGKVLVFNDSGELESIQEASHSE
jgi:hypothetical protein